MASAGKWIEGRVSQVVNATHAIIQVPLPIQPSAALAAAATVFDPASPLTSYQDEGTCGPRGDDAQANTKACPLGAELVRSVPMDSYKVVATVKGCRFFSYKIYRCRQQPAGDTTAGSRVVLPAWQVVPLAEDAELGEAEGSAAQAPRCPSFLEEGKRIAMILLGDLRFQARYRTQIQSLRCFANQHGYELRILVGNEYAVCKKYVDYFFRKHCTVAEWLETQHESLVAAIVDADVVAAVMERGLEKWANHPADVQLYQRCLLPEIMAGNYMVRNTPFARKFLREWARYNFEMPKGFSSSDNGAIHLVVQDTVQAVDFAKCKKMYKGLDKPVTDLSQYFKFVKCVTDALGPPRDWHSHGGVVTVWPRMSFWAADGVYMAKMANPGMGPVLHHGIKDAKDVTGHYWSNVSTCSQNAEEVIRPPQELAKHMTGLIRGYKEYFPQGLQCSGTAPRQCPERCLPSFSCWPLADQEPPLPKRTCTDCA